MREKHKVYNSCFIDFFTKNQSLAMCFKDHSSYTEKDEGKQEMRQVSIRGLL